MPDAGGVARGEARHLHSGDRVTDDVHAIDVHRGKELANVLDERLRVVLRRRGRVGRALAAAAEAHDMKGVREAWRKRIEPMDVVSQTGKQKDGIAAAAPIDVL